MNEWIVILWKIVMVKLSSSFKENEQTRWWKIDRGNTALRGGYYYFISLNYFVIDGFVILILRGYTYIPFSWASLMLWSFVKDGKIYHLFSQFYSVYPVLGQWSKYIDQFASIDYPWSTLHFKTLTPAPASLWQVSGAGEISHQHVALDWSPQKLTIVNKHPPKIDQLISGQGKRDH